jgi:hypothetical protein
MAANPFLSALGAVSGLQGKPAPEDEPYFAALGRFIAAYAVAEANVHMLARHLTNLPDEKARILFDRVSLDRLMERIRQMMRLDGADPCIFDDVDACLSHLAIIAQKRHNIVHRFVQYNEGQITVTNALTAKHLKSIETESFTITDLNNMQADCAVISVRLRRISDPEEAPNASFQEFLHGPWRYR